MTRRTPQLKPAEARNRYACPPGRHGVRFHARARVSTLAFLSALAGLAACDKDTGLTTGGQQSQACQVREIEVNFGSVSADGSSADRAFTIRNIGRGVLSGNASLSSGQFTIVSGGGRYSLGEGQIRTVVVRYRPDAPGSHEGQVALGVPCRAVRLLGQATAGRSCRVEPGLLEFGSVSTDGSFVDRAFRIVNPGGAPLAGSVTIPCDQYSLLSGGGTYSLASGESLTVTVRFRPSTAGNHDCLIETGPFECSDVTCTGQGAAPPECVVLPTRLDLGSVCVGSSREGAFILENRGSAPFQGDVREDCLPFAITAGGGPFNLGPGEQRLLTVRFDPAAPGLQECAIQTGVSTCSTITCVGLGNSTPLCEASTTSLDFGTVDLGSTRSQSLTLRNAGCGQMSGRLSETCPSFSILTGGGDFVLGPGEARVVQIRFEPAVEGPAACTIETEVPGCPTISCMGQGRGVPLCEVSPASLDFGTVMTTGGFSDRMFTVRNAGGGVLAGSVSESCADFTVLSGGGSFALGAGQSRSVTVRFQPAIAGERGCSIDLGAPECPSVLGTGMGEDPPLCTVTPSSLSFGDVPVGAAAERSFTIRNSGGGTVSGNVTESCLDFSIVSGLGAFALQSGESRLVTVRFTPVVIGQAVCGVGLNSALCVNVACSGTGRQPSDCELDPALLDFGAVAAGTTSDRTFTIRNVAGGVLSGTVVESCPEFSIVSGGGPFSLSVGQSRAVTVRFEPSSPGTKTCTVETGSPECGALVSTGIAEPPPLCETSADLVALGTVVAGQSSEASFVLRNAGGGVISGVISESCDEFSIASGGGSYSLGAGQERIVVVRFSPTSAGNKVCTVETGSALCSDVTLTGTGILGPQCSVTPPSLDFGTVVVGDSADRTFIITNAGDQTLSGSIAESCSEFSIPAGGGSYSLAPAATRNVTVRFRPASTGLKSCSVDLGNLACGLLEAAGTGDTPPTCQVSPASLSFGGVPVGSASDRTFTIQNTGGGILTGNVIESCADFSIQANGGGFSLSGGQSRLVTVRFQPGSLGLKTCAVETGTSMCPDVAINGTGDPPPQCSVSVSSLDFGLVTVGTFFDRSFTIRNVGGGVLTGTVSEACSGYSIVSGAGAYNLTANQTRTVTVRFTPSAFGTATCTIVTGGSCSGVSCTGVGAVSFAAHVTPQFQTSCALAGCHNGMPLPDFRDYQTSLNRVDLGNPPNSLLLRKPAGQVSHGGGTVAGWMVGQASYSLVLTWIQQGAANN